MAYLRKNRFFTITILLLWHVVGTAPPAAIAESEKEETRWERVEASIGKKRYTRNFIDSLKAALTISDEKSLRILPDTVFPFAKREKMVFEGVWGFVRAGYGSFDAEFKKDEGILAVVGKVFTNNFASAFYKVRDFAYATLDAQGLYAIFFEQEINENRYSKHSWYFSDHEKGKLYTNGRSDDSIFTITRFSNNYISLLYYLRTIQLTPGDTFSIRCFVHGKDYPIFFKALKREEIRVKAGTFVCVKVEPKLVGEGRGFTKGDKMYLWFSDDRYHLLVKASSKVALGYISGELIHYERE
jgi:hypothetical protein